MDLTDLQITPIFEITSRVMDRLAPVQGVPLHRLRAGPEQPHTSATSVEMKVHFGCANRLEEILVILHLQKWLGYVRFIFRVKLFRPLKPSNK